MPEARPRLRVRRVYDAPARGDGRRILVDRLWPRGLTKETALNNAVALKEYLESRRG